MEQTPESILAVWQQHTFAEFVSKNLEDALATMTEDAYVFLVPAGAGGYGKPAVREFYGKHFIPNIPADIQAIPISQTIGTDSIIEEAIYSFTHDIAMDWMIPGIPPTGKRVEVAVIGRITFRDGKVASEHLYWDQASVFTQLGVLNGANLHIPGAAGAQRLLEYSQKAAQAAQ